MAVPKKRKSKSKTRMRLAKYYGRLKKPANSICDNCSSIKTPHVVCEYCGFYKGKLVRQVVSN